MIEINLLPGAASKSHAHGSAFNLTTAFATAGQSFRDKYLLGTVATVVVALAAVAGMYYQQSVQDGRLAERERRAAQDSARYSAVLTARSGAEAARDSVYHQLAIIKSIDDSRFLWPHVMEEVSRALPPYTWLISIVQTSAPTSAAAAAVDTAAPKAKGDTSKSHTKLAAERARRARADSVVARANAPVKFRIVGNTVDIQALTRFMKALESSPFIQNVQLTRSDLIVVDNKDVTEFQLEAETQTPPKSLLQSAPLSMAVR